VGVLFDLVADAAKETDPSARRAAAALLVEALEVFGLGALLERTPGDAPSTSLDAAIVGRIAARIGDAVHFNGAGPEAAIAAVIEARAQARQARDFALGDRLRDALAAEGVVLHDSKDGTTWTLDGG
jgi:cysteinyl-tRNA synthetase